VFFAYNYEQCLKKTVKRYDIDEKDDNPKTLQKEGHGRSSM